MLNSTNCVDYLSTKTLSFYFCLIFFFTFSNNTFSQATSEVIVTIDWPLWSVDNKVEIYDPSGNLIQTICNDDYNNTCYSGINWSGAYSNIINLGCVSDGYSTEQ